MIKKLMTFIFLFAIVPVWAQPSTPNVTHLNEYGFDLSIAMSGTGLGGFYRKALPGYFLFGASANIYMMRDEKEFSYYNPYDPYQPYPVQINKFNRFFVLPVSVELKRRLFMDSVDDSFRPYLLTSGGLSFGINFPRKDQISRLPEEEQYKYPTDTELGWALNFAIGFGVDFTTHENYYLTIRPQYRFIYFPDEIALKKNHSNFEIVFELGKRVF
ncbi:MAG: hypothetical protein Kow0037_17850 [Calditrichia bacterium]